MTSPTRLQRGAYYHIYNRGTNRENIFREERNYSYFLKLYAQHIEPVAETYAYCLLKNHFHVLVRIVDGHSGSQDEISSPSQAFSNLFNAYSKAINKAYARTGSLFEHPFGRVEVNDPVYFGRLVTYILRNPQRHRLVTDFRDWKCSSYHALITYAPTRLQRETVIGWFDDPENFTAAHARESLEPAIESLVSEDFD